MPQLNATDDSPNIYGVFEHDTGPPRGQARVDRPHSSHTPTKSQARACGASIRAKPGEAQRLLLRGPAQAAQAGAGPNFKSRNVYQAFSWNDDGFERDGPSPKSKDPATANRRQSVHNHARWIEQGDDWAPKRDVLPDKQLWYRREPSERRERRQQAETNLSRERQAQDRARCEAYLQKQAAHEAALARKINCLKSEINIAVDKDRLLAIDQLHEKHVGHAYNCKDVYSAGVNARRRQLRAEADRAKLQLHAERQNVQKFVSDPQLVYMDIPEIATRTKGR